MRRPLARASLALAALLAVAPAVADPRFDVIEPLPGRIRSEPLDVSADGCVVVGHSDFDAFRWRDGVSAPVLEDPSQNPLVAHAITSNGGAVAGESRGGRAFYLYLGSPQGVQSLPSLGGFRLQQGFDVAAPFGGGGGLEVVGIASDGLGHGYYPFYWDQQGRTQILPGGFGEARALSSDGSVAGGSASGQAALWRPWSDPAPQWLGYLPGSDYSEVRALSGDGGVAVGRSGTWSGGSRAFRRAAAGMHDLGPNTTAAHGVSADGSLVVGEGWFPSIEQGSAFVWDARHGVRSLAEVLRDVYGLDLGEFRLLSATAVSPDGKTFVGHGLDAQGAPKGWRARLQDERCPPEPQVEDVLAGYAGDPPLDELAGLAADSTGRVYVTGRTSYNLLRFDPANPGAPPEELIDFAASPPPGISPFGDVPSVLGVGPDDALYLGAYSNRQLLRRTRAGALEVVVDGSSWPPLPPYSTKTAPVSLAIAPDGTLFVAAVARLLRIDPDGSLHELLDAASAGQLSGVASAPLEFVALGSEGRVFASTYYGGFYVLAPGSAPAFVPYPVSFGSNFSRDPAGGFWISGDAVAHIGPEGQLRVLFADGRVPDGSGGTLDGSFSLVGDDDGNAYYRSWRQGKVLRLSPEGDVRVIGAFQGTPAHFSGGMLYLAYFDAPDQMWLPCPPYYEWDCLVDSPDPPLIMRFAPAAGTACTNGLDDDGDGAIDFPEDPGCVSTEDEGERSTQFSCDNGVDDDRDGSVDFPADPGCASLGSSPEATACDDGLDNDRDWAVDWDGAFDELSGTWLPPDPECAGDAKRVIEHPWYCGLGFEVALVALPLLRLGRRLRRRQG